MKDTPAIQLWHAGSSSDEPGLLERCCESVLSDEELLRANQFRVPTSRNQHVVGRGMARRLLGRGQVEPEEICFAIEKNGKPYVTQPSWARCPFNIAHTDGLVMCGIGTECQGLLGVDVEKTSRRTDPALADRYFSQPEIEILRRCGSENVRRNTFLKIWTLKEAFIKAIGTGLRTPLAEFAFERIDSRNPVIRMLNPDLESIAHWSFFLMEPRPGYIGAVAFGADSAAQQPDLKLQRFEDVL